METEFLYERLRTRAGVKVELVSGSEQRDGRLWELMAKQVYAENGKDGYRVLGHFSSGAPMLEDEPCRISLTHARHLLVVATLPPTPGIPLDRFDQRTALGIDAERLDREQVLRVRDRVFTRPELQLIPSDELESNIMGWTIKEAVWKAMLTPGLDLCASIMIKRLPKTAGEPGLAVVKREGETDIEFELHSFIYAGCMVTIAITAQTHTYLHR